MSSLALALVAFLLPEPSLQAAPARQSPPAPALVPRLREGDRISNVFSISQSVAAQGFDEVVRRNGGSGDYVVTRAARGEHSFAARFSYDGTPPSMGTVTISAAGATTCWNGSCQPTTDASGPLFNPNVWGQAPRNLYTGQTWRTKISMPWELAGSGEQTVTVTATDHASRCVTLMRTGTSNESALSEPATVRLKRDGVATEFKIAVGTSTWKGLATICKGQVRNDELLVERTDTLSAPGIADVVARRRTIMLLNAAPPPPPAVD